MTALIILFLIVLLIIVLVYARSVEKMVMQMSASLRGLIDETMKLRNEVKNLREHQGPEVKPATQESLRPQTIIREPVPAVEKPVPSTAIPSRPPVTPAAEKADKEIYSNNEPSGSDWFSQWLSRNPDLEKFIGENLVNKIGIAILVLGIAFFVKFAIDRNWINEAGRVSIGMLSGLVLNLLAHRLRQNYRSFSSVLAGGGIAVYFFTIALAFHQYQLISQTAAFLVMVAITGFAVLLSLLYDRLELAVIAAIGGFLTPFMVSTGDGNYVVLFTYLIILNTGLLLLSYFKRWPSVNIISFGFTLVIYTGWLTGVLTRGTDVSFPLALFFASVLYLVFLAMNLVYQVRRKMDFRPFDFSILLTLNAAYYTAGMFILQQIEQGRYQGLFTLAAGTVNLSIAWYLFRRHVDRNLVFLLIGLTLTFLSLTIPVQLEGHAITLFWSAEFVLLFWLYQRSGIRLYYFSSVLIGIMSVGSLLMDWGQAGMRAPGNIVLIFDDIRGIVTNIVAAVAFGCLFYLTGKETTPSKSHIREIRITSGLVSILITYLTAVYGVNLFFRNEGSYDIPNIYHRLVTEIFIAVIIILLPRVKKEKSGILSLAVAVVYLLYHIFSYKFIWNATGSFLSGSSAFHMIMHWTSSLAALILLYAGLHRVRSSQLPVKMKSMAWLLSIIMVIFFSMEFRHIYMVVSAGSEMPEYGGAMLTIVWSLCSFGLMWLGMKYSFRTLRIISLCLFSLALLKLFFSDLSGITEAGRITSFILLGILLLTISFMYQKLKKIIIDEKD